jgi:hypothetical protein
MSGFVGGSGMSGPYPIVVGPFDSMASLLWKYFQVTVAISWVRFRRFVEPSWPSLYSVFCSTVYRFHHQASILCHVQNVIRWQHTLLRFALVNHSNAEHWQLNMKCRPVVSGGECLRLHKTSPRIFGARHYRKIPILHNLESWLVPTTSCLCFYIFQSLSTI